MICEQLCHQMAKQQVGGQKFVEAIQKHAPMVAAQVQQDIARKGAAEVTLQKVAKFSTITISQEYV